MIIMKILKIYQKEYYQSENALNYNDEIQNIILNILDDDNICELNRDISKILSIDNKFCDVLAIFVDNLLNEDSKLYFKFFQVFHKIKIDCQLFFS